MNGSSWPRRKSQDQTSKALRGYGSIKTWLVAKLHCYGCFPSCLSLTCLFKFSFRFVPSVATLLLQPASFQGQKYRSALGSCISSKCRSRPVCNSNARSHRSTAHLYGRVCFLICLLIKYVSLSIPKVRNHSEYLLQVSGSGKCGRTVRASKAVSRRGA